MTSCLVCGRGWTGHTQCHCSGCHEHFGGVVGFDAHRTAGDGVNGRGCLPPADLRRRDGNPVLLVLHGSNGPVWVQWRTDVGKMEAHR